MAEEKKNQLQIEAKNEVLQGVYANQVVIQHTGEEFLLNFITALPPKGIMGARVIISPKHAKRFLKAFQNNIAQYEKKFGEIKEDQPSSFEGMMN